TFLRLRRRQKHGQGRRERPHRDLGKGRPDERCQCQELHRRAKGSGALPGRRILMTASSSETACERAPPPALPVPTTCPYCGVGCGVLATPDGMGGAAIRGDPKHPANFGRLCSKGSALGETL